MASNKAIEQALTWLDSKAHDEDTLDSINAELCKNVIMDLQRQYDKLGIQFGTLSRQRKDSSKEDHEQISFLE